jgi:predicted nucleic acid-binding protein
MNDKIFIDTNILVYAHDTSNRLKRKRAQEILFKGIQEENIVISTQVICELFVTLTKKLGMTVANARKEVSLLNYTLIIEITYPMILESIDLHRSQKISFWDALIIVAGNTSECNILYSEDLNHGQRVNGLKIINPFL